MSGAWPVLVPAIGWALLHFVWQGMLIGWVASLGLHLLRGAPPQARYALACGALLLCAALPLSGIALRLADGALGAAYPAAPSILSSSSADTGPAAGAGQGAATRDGGPAAAMAGLVLNRLLDADQRIALDYALRRQLPWVVLLWCCGAALMALRLVVGLRWVAERTGADHYSVNHYWQRRLSQLARRFDIGVHVRLGVTALLDSPVTAGCWRPMVLVPAALVTGMPPELLEALLAHELAHIKRHDYLVNLIQSAIEIALFYHPSVWALSRRIRIEREQIADDMAVAVLGQPQRLAQALSELDRFQFATTQLAHAAHGGNLMSRIKRLLRPDVEPVSWKMALPLLGLCAAGAVLYAQAAPVSAPVDGAAVAAAAPMVVAVAAAAPAEPAAPAAPAAAAAPAAPAAAAAFAPPPAPPAPAAAAVSRAARVRPALADIPATPAVAVIAAVPAIAALPAMPAVPAVPALAPLPALPPAPVIPAARSARSLTFDRADITMRDTGTAYALMRGNGERTMISGSQQDMLKIADARNKIKGDFVWYRDGDQTYVIQDPDLLAKADQAWQPVKRLGAQMDQQGKLMDVQGKALDVIGKRMEAASRHATEGPQARDMARQQEQFEQLAQQQGHIGSQIGEAAQKLTPGHTDAERAEARVEMARLRAAMAPLAAQMHERQAAMAKVRVAELQAPLQAMGKEMELAARPMRELGQQMGQLGREQQRASREAEQLTRALIQDAIRNGKAVRQSPSA